MKLIGLAGFAGSGKDTLYTELVAAKIRAGDLTTPIRRFAFADILKDELACALGLSSTQAINDDKAAYRELMQAWGATRRRLNLAYWICKLDNAMGWASHIDTFASNPPPESYNVVTDVRYENEVDYIRSQGGIIVLVSRPGVGPAYGHESEQLPHRIKPDFQVENCGTPAFAREAEWLWETIKGVPRP